MRTKISLTFLLLFLTLEVSFSQQLSVGKVYESHLNGETVGFKELLETLQNTDSNLYLRNITVRWKDEEDRPYMDGRYFNKDEPDTIFIKQYVEFIDCNFDPMYWLLFRNVVFENHISFYGCENMKVIFTGCRFNRSLRTSNNHIEFIDFKRTTFNEGYKLVRSTVTDHVKFDSCLFDFHEPKDMQLLGLDMNPVVFEVENRVEALNLEITKCTFQMDSSLMNDPNYFIQLDMSIYNTLKVTNNTFNGHVAFSETTIENLFLLRNNDFNERVFVNSLNVNELNSKIEWEDVSGGVIGVIHDGKIYDRNCVDVDNDFFAANDLFSSYATLFYAFRSQGNRIYANACYIEWKDAETKWLGSYYQTTEDRLPFFMYLMNKFLGVFCDYGTNPTKALILSLDVILFFALLFLFSSEFNSNASNSVSLLAKRLFFDANEPSEIIQLRLQDIGTIPKTEERSGIPQRFKNLFGRNNGLEKLLLKTYSLLGDGKGLLSGGTILVLNLLLVANLIVIKIIQSILLSLNIYSTLGFGNIPLKGVFRFLSILEGVCGWFLLSIFSVSLISQVLQ